MLATLTGGLEAVRAFAGDNYHIAVTYPDDEQFELLSDPYVFQHEVSEIAPL
ncbi:hypothetical protein [Chromobacterium sp. Beijing]|uniref:hypothetical protein n=1 Tax=Chromobacterium sp. Beijing TaxID=2735795 RepID=UPI001F42AA99|nr:hypothetical protein [Chromobacterium sp. Beijing]UJB31241.1 antibiotic biosynthesis monooxygenase [Chromobacterium sp. Beijing]